MADTETLTVIRPATIDRFGDPVPAASVEFELPGVNFAPGRTDELNAVGGGSVEAEAAAYCPPGPPYLDVRPTDRIRRKGVVYRVVGQPQDWGSDGVVILLRRFTG